MTASKKDGARQFQSTLPRRERLHHEPVQICKDICFNPRSREGSDAVSLFHYTLINGFNPRSREGSDEAHTAQREVKHGFNPRSREGSDEGDIIKLRKLNTVSIHAPAKGATNSHVITSI